MAAFSWVWDNTDLRGDDLVLVLTLADACDELGMGFMPTYARIAQRVRCGVEEVPLLLQGLLSRGWIDPRGIDEGYPFTLRHYANGLNEANEAIGDGRIPQFVDGQPGHVYLLASEMGFCKIGKTGHLSHRIEVLKIQLPFRVELVHSIQTNNITALEKYLHHKYAAKRRNGEWFELSAEDIEDIKAHELESC